MGDNIIQYYEEVDNIYFGNGLYARDGIVTKLNPDYEIMIGNFVLDTKSKTVRNLANTPDSFPKTFANEIKNKKIQVRKDGAETIITLDGAPYLTLENQLITKLRMDADKIPQDFLTGRNASVLRDAEFPNLKTLGRDSMINAWLLERLDAPHLQEMGANCFHNSPESFNLNLPMLKEWNEHCFGSTAYFDSINLPSLEKLHDNPLPHQQIIHNAPRLKTVEPVNEVYLPAGLTQHELPAHLNYIGRFVLTYINEPVDGTEPGADGKYHMNLNWMNIDGELIVSNAYAYRAIETIPDKNWCPNVKLVTFDEGDADTIDTYLRGLHPNVENLNFRNAPDVKNLDAVVASQKLRVITPPMSGNNFIIAAHKRFPDAMFKTTVRADNINELEKLPGKNLRIERLDLTRGNDEISTLAGLPLAQQVLLDASLFPDDILKDMPPETRLLELEKPSAGTLDFIPKNSGLKKMVLSGMPAELPLSGLPVGLEHLIMHSANTDLGGISHLHNLSGLMLTHPTPQTILSIPANILNRATVDLISNSPRDKQMLADLKDIAKLPLSPAATKIKSAVIWARQQNTLDEFVYAAVVSYVNAVANGENPKSPEQTLKNLKNKFNASVIEQLNLNWSPNTNADKIKAAIAKMKNKPSEHPQYYRHNDKNQSFGMAADMHVHAELDEMRIDLSQLMHGATGPDMQMSPHNGHGME